MASLERKTENKWRPRELGGRASYLEILTLKKYAFEKLFDPHRDTERGWASDDLLEF